MDTVVIFGAGQFGEVAHYYLSHDSPYKVAAFCADGAYLKESSLLGLPVVPFESLQTEFPPERFGILVAMSYKQVNRLRAEKLAAAEAKGYKAISYVSSKASIWPDLEVGANTFILEDNTIQPYVRIGRNSTLWSGNHIGHHTTIGRNCFIASHVVVSGAVVIGDFTFIGVNATIRDNVTVGSANVIGAGSLILADTRDGEVYRADPTAASRVPSHRLRGI
jgi:sugar O-acyltransferase (sialic acid O-acetyltransferase NeuD family)